jgi:phosphorylcholine metabolism protein LicD
MDSIKAFNNLLIIKRILDTLHIVSWLDCGTALGAYRENSFISHDIDIDIGVFGEDDAHIPKIVDALNKEKLDYLHVKEHPCGKGKQISGIINGVPFDIYFFYLKGKERCRLFFDESNGGVKYIPCIFPSYLFDNLSEIDFMDYGVMFNLPNPTDEYLTLNYGDWRTPQKNFHWQTDFKCMDMEYKI